MRNSPEAASRTAAVNATYRVSSAGNSSDWARAAAQHARRNIVDGYTPAEEYAAVAAYFNDIADALVTA